MSMWKKLGALAIASLMALGLMTGCSSGSGSSSGGNATTAQTGNGSTNETTGKKELNILMEAVPDTDYVMAELDKFKEATGITVNVEVVNYSSMHEKLLTQLLATTSAYDVIVVDFYWTGEFTSAGWLTDLDPYIKASNFDTSVYTDSMMEMVGKMDGVTYQLPFYNYMMSLIYRTDVWSDPDLAAAYKAQTGKEFGIPTTMEDYVEACKFISEQKGKDTMAGAVMQGLRPDPIAMEWLNYLYSCGGDFYDADGKIIINNEAAVHALDLYVDNMNNAAPEGAPGFGFDEAFNVFAQGNAASYVTYNWMLPKLNNSDESTVGGKVDIAKMPGEGISLNAGWGWAIPHNAEDPDASWKFLEWIESFEIAKDRALAGGSPTRTDVMTDADVLAAYPHMKTVNEIMSASKSMPIMEDEPQLIEVLGRELSEAVTGAKTSQEALNTVAEEMASLK